MSDAAAPTAPTTPTAPTAPTAARGTPSQTVVRSTVRQVLPLLAHQRWRSTTWWVVGVVVTTLLVALSYPSVAASADAIDAYSRTLPEGVQRALGATTGMASPSGYLDTKLFTSTLPLLLSVLATGAGAWAVAGAEAAGELELLLAGPLPRRHLVWGRALGCALVVVAVAGSGAATLALASPSTHLAAGLAPGGVWLATASAAAPALLFGALALATGAATGRRGVAVGVSAAALAGTYLLHGLVGSLGAADRLSPLLPWTWQLAGDPLRTGTTSTFWLESLLLPLGLAALLVALGAERFERRDLR